MIVKRFKPSADNLQVLPSEAGHILNPWNLVKCATQELAMRVFLLIPVASQEKERKKARRQDEPQNPMGQVHLNIPLAAT